MENKKMKILMVCLGNICRSPLAEGILKKKCTENKLDWEIDSAGTESFHVGEAPHRLSQKVAEAHGIDISGQRARRFKRTDFQYYDKIYAMAGDVYQEIMDIGGKDADASRVELLLNEAWPGSNRSVPDPWYGGEDGYHEAWQLIDTACGQIVKKYH